MKFVRLRMLNFMRYKGENSLEFSCDKEKNVTVVLGDNTIGKTTLAQAFRWVLYGELISTQYEEVGQICILNNEILGDMTANDHRNVEVELIIEDSGDYEYKIVRKAIFSRKFPQMIAVQQAENLKVYVTDKKNGKTEPYDNGGVNGRNRGKADELISELLPKNLSSYFLFDGERWSNTKNTRSDIKDSIYSLVGISPIREMKRHLGECGTQGRQSVIKQLKGKITGSGNEYAEIVKEIESLEKNIDREEKKKAEALKEAKHYSEKADEVEEMLKENPRVEQDQKEYEILKREISLHENRMKNQYADIVSDFSKMHTYFAAPLLQQVVDLLKDVELEGVNIPGVIDKTIDFLLERHSCLCGHPILEDSSERDVLIRLKAMVPPAVIGTIAGNLQDKIEKWKYEGADLNDAIVEKARIFQQEYDDMSDKEEEKERKEKKIDKKINFAQERIKMNSYRKKEREENEAVRQAGLNIEYYQKEIEKLEKKKETMDERTEQNAKLKEYIAYAEALYAAVCTMYQKKEGSLLSELNEIIERNFREMFNEQEKVARLGEDYTLRLFYKRVSNTNGYSDLEATGLSEGEKIARNFAFIVSILELANKKKSEGDEVAQSLPLVLDGPFSKLSSVNTSKVAKVLPSVSEQVIIFMLDKDWEPSGLGAFTDPKYMYRTMKDIDGNSSIICSEV